MRNSIHQDKREDYNIQRHYDDEQYGKKKKAKECLAALLNDIMKKEKR